MYKNRCILLAIFLLIWSVFIVSCASSSRETKKPCDGLMVLTNAFDLIEENYIDPVDASLLANEAVLGMEEHLKSRSNFVSANHGINFYNSRSERAKALGYLSSSFNYYVSVTDGDPFELQYAAIEAMVKSLDPYCSYLTPELYEDLRSFTRGNYCGIGIEVAMIEGVITVVSPIDDTPAYHAGVEAGDRIIAINGEPTAGFTVNDAFRVLRGPAGTTVTITIDRNGDQCRKFIIQRKDITIQSVKHRIMEGGVGYVRVAAFQETTTTELRNALRDMRAAGTLRGIIIDLRNNPGGLLDEAITVSDIFLASGVIVRSEGRADYTNRTYQATRDGEEVLCPMIILVNRGTASASEVVAFALRDNDKALLFGSRTAGKGTIQSVTELCDGSALKLTMAKYYSAKGRAFQETGIIPDLCVGDRKEMEKYGAAGNRGDVVNEDEPVFILYEGGSRDLTLMIAHAALSRGTGLPGKDELKMLAGQVLNR